MSASNLPLNQAVHALYTEHHGWLFGWLRKKLGCPHNAADLSHDTFVRILASRDALGGMREPRAFLTTTARHLIIDRARRRRLEEAYLRELALTVEHMQARGVLLYSSKAMQLAQLPKLLANVNCPTLIAGPTVHIHHTELSARTAQTADLFLAEDPLAAHQALLERGLI